MSFLSHTTAAAATTAAESSSSQWTGHTRWRSAQRWRRSAKSWKTRPGTTSARHSTCRITPLPKPGNIYLHSPVHTKVTFFVFTSGYFICMAYDDLGLQQVSQPQSQLHQQE